MEVIGSSPLARGLHIFWKHFLFLSGIIPARAGFTLLFPLCCALTGIIPARAGFTAADGDAHGVEEDHPRSRGVYLGRRS